MPESIVVGLNCTEQRVKGDILGTFQYVGSEPALILCPVRPKPSGGVHVICESAIPWYLNLTEPQWILKTLAIADTLGMDPTKHTTWRIRDAILEWIPLLIAMPPKPNELKRVVDEAIISVNGRENLAQRFE